MSIGNTTETDILALYFTATAIANIADNAASSPNTNVYYSLHTGDPGEAGDQTTNEAAYTSYARKDVLRNGTGHTAAAGSVSPDANVEFVQATGGSETETFFATGKAASAAGVLWWSGSISPTIAVTNGVQPILTTATACTLD